MAKTSKFEQNLSALDFPFKRKKRTRAEDLRSIIQEVVEELDLGDHRGSPKTYGVTCDRTKSTYFDYWLFDEMLVQLDAGGGGGGIRKPLNQLRLMSWRKGPKKLMQAIQRICGNYPELRFHRLLVFEVVQGTNAGFRLLRGTYRR